MARARTRDEILSAAARLFGRNGFKGTSLNEIATEVGCSKATVLYHFESKDAILVALIAPATEHLVALDTTIRELDADAAQAAAIDGFVELVVAYPQPVTLVYADPQLVGMPVFADLQPVVDRLVEAFAGRSREVTAQVAAGVVLSGICTIGTNHNTRTDDPGGHAPISDTELRTALVQVARRALLNPNQGA
jgi:AcrR family transcriptional regulator